MRAALASVPVHGITLAPAHVDGLASPAGSTLLGLAALCLLSGLAFQVLSCSLWFEIAA